MVLPTCLKWRHSLKGVRLVADIKRIRRGQAQGLKEFARFQKDKKVLDLTGAELQFANRDKTVEEARTGFVSVFKTPTTSANPVNVQMSGDIVQSSGYNNNNGTNKRKRDDLEDMIASLESTTKEEVVKNLKDLVRTLCLQNNPSDSLILLTLEELAKAARRVNHDNADTFEELKREANRHQLKLYFSSLCLSVMGGKVADAITKAVSKYLKEKQPEKKTTPKPEDSTLHNLYLPYQATCMYPYNAMPYFIFSLFEMSSFIIQGSLIP
ncbi:uncharacterized protein LOC134687929 [Mytilus trossulus]|uniref:uncharacterized protein LOC134687929 n=1 Tax=Mytilus trossulus TaxID=6551 RepID=UPI00300525CA